MRVGVQAALISGVFSIAAVVVSVFLSDHLENQAQNEEIERQRSEELKAIPDNASRSSTQSSEVMTGNLVASRLKLTSERAMSATAISRKNDDAAEDKEGPVQADLCILTKVSKYGEGTSNCTLMRESTGWWLFAISKGATAKCQATCYILAEAKTTQ